MCNKTVATNKHTFSYFTQTNNFIVADEFHGVNMTTIKRRKIRQSSNMEHITKNCPFWSLLQSITILWYITIHCQFWGILPSITSLVVYYRPYLVLGHITIHHQFCGILLTIISFGALYHPSPVLWYITGYHQL